MEIDCVFDELLAQELALYLRKKGHHIAIDKAIITIKDDPIDDVVNFSVETHHQDYQISFFEDTLIFAKKIQAEKLGLVICKQCGFLAQNKVDLEMHQDTHIPKSWVYTHKQS